MNLTRIADRGAAEAQHVGDALTLLPFLKPGPLTLADVGSGGGVPGIPLAVVRPELAVTLIEATRKKAAFLQSAVDQLGLGNVRVLAGAEDAGRGELRETFDVAVVRAVATTDWLAEWCLPLVRKGGRMLAMKGPKVGEELPQAAKAIRVSGGGTPVAHPVRLAGTDGRVVVEIPKVARAESRYPRPPSIAKNNPVG